MNNGARMALGAGVAAVAALLLTAGLLRTHEVYDVESGESEVLTSRNVPERELAEDATFSGVIRKDGRLYSTYDRTAPRGKQSCPT